MLAERSALDRGLAPSSGVYLSFEGISADADGVYAYMPDDANILEDEESFALAMLHAEQDAIETLEHLLNELEKCMQDKERVSVPKDTFPNQFEKDVKIINDYLNSGAVNVEAILTELNNKDSYVHYGIRSIGWYPFLIMSTFDLIDIIRGWIVALKEKNNQLIAPGVCNKKDVENYFMICHYIKTHFKVLCHGLILRF